MTYSLAWFDSDKFNQHINGPNHPECPERLDAIREYRASTNLESRVEIRTPTPIGRQILQKTHHNEYIERIYQATLKNHKQLDSDTSVCPGSWPAALLGAGALINAVDFVLEQPNRRAFCSPRPPGHHARPNQAMGFCLFNNIAIGAQHALTHKAVKRVAILDWDVHHGNGTQEIFYGRSDVFFASIHQHPFYPGTGKESECGSGNGVGTTLNCPLPSGATDHDYLRCWNETIRPALDTFEPDCLFISAGFDADARDPIGGLDLTPSGFEKLTYGVSEWSKQACNGRIISSLEGGYNTQALGEDVSLHVNALLG